MKNVLITGATGGIGAAILEIFHKNGFNIIATGTNDEKLNSLKLIPCFLLEIPKRK